MVIIISRLLDPHGFDAAVVVPVSFSFPPTSWPSRGPVVPLPASPPAHPIYAAAAAVWRLRPRFGCSSLFSARCWASWSALYKKNTPPVMVGWKILREYGQICTFATRRGGLIGQKSFLLLWGITRKDSRGGDWRKSFRRRSRRTVGGQSGEGGGEGQGKCDHRREAQEVPDSNFVKLENRLWYYEQKCWLPLNHA